ncbi:TauD/TfdA dioxygenase family protein [Novosphingobium album (ex Hu et al. 2023)]|uniref:TauD/TfdA family dioxygenase n=1 Tax=Novosphingobium album (ex Hu et al. 2023) TaxID=2930093 RepID=A0ABT0B1S6_9SPHN|nr:TauD/TfdA family dioxygenase [Novosphingobium album (ex Hu et al. 2023)]MCJ2178833.1 TauD/TfdA family dioxygenase [Novosphingobium album (ex Hu et al. 2023)]
MKFRPLHRDFGVEVLGFDTQTGGTEAEIDALRSAWDAHGLLLFRGGGRLSPERQLEIAAWFGPPPPVANGGKDDFVTVLRNDDAAGSVMLPFHSDLTYTDHPIHGICLHAIALPQGATATTFVSGTAGWRHLPQDLKDDVEGTTLRHKLDMFASGYDWPVFIAEHPTVLPHPRTGQPVLFVTQYHADRILEFDDGRSRAVLEHLFAHLYADEARYDHIWQLHDLLMIDNIALQHARMAHADPAEGERALQRVALSDATLDELVERARAQEAARA